MSKFAYHRTDAFKHGRSDPVTAKNPVDCGDAKSVIARAWGSADFLHAGSRWTETAISLLSTEGVNDEQPAGRNIPLLLLPQAFRPWRAASYIALAATMLGAGTAHAAAWDQANVASAPGGRTESVSLDGSSAGQEMSPSSDRSRATKVDTFEGQADATVVGSESGGSLPPMAVADPASAGGTQQVTVQSGERASLVSFDTVAADDPDTNPEQLLALFPDGKGQAITGMDELDLTIGQRQIFSDLRSLQDRINDTQRPTANAVVRHSSQSDNLDINQAELSQDLFFSAGRSELRLGLQAIDYDSRDLSDISQYSAGFTGSHRINDIAAVTGEFWVNQLRASGDHDVKATYNAFLTLKPSDSVRVDLSTSRRIFDNIRSLQLGLSVTSYSGSIDFSPMDDLRLTFRGSYGSYSDGNRRTSEEVQGVWRIRSSPVLEFGVRATNFHFSRLLNNGYFNPEDYVSGEGMFRLLSSVSQKLTFELAGSAGAEHADPGGTRPIVKGSLQLVYKLLNGWSIDSELSHFSSRQSSSSGFSRTTALLGLHYRF